MPSSSIAGAAFDIAKLAPDDRPSYDALLRIYQHSIEPSEQKSPVEIAVIVANPRYVVLVLRIDGEVRGFAISFFPGGDFWLLEYLAVDATLRSRGLGRALFLAANHAAHERNPASPCVLEVDQSLPGLSSRNDKQRRLRFYRALGCRRVAGLGYILPLAVNGTPPPMMLLVHGLDALQTLPKPQLAGWLASIYAEVYGKSADDPRIDTMLAPLPDAISLVAS